MASTSEEQREMRPFEESGQIIEKWEIPARTERGGENILPDIARTVLEKIGQKAIKRKMLPE